MLDTTQTVETPEGIDLRLRIAGPTVRSFAWIIDFGIRVAFYVVTAIVLSMFSIISGELVYGLLLIVLFLIEWFYPVFFEVYNQGATPGKRSLNLRVVNDNGTPVQWSGSVLRNLLRSVDFLPMFYGVGVIVTFINPRFKRLGDLAAGTVVIYDDQHDQNRVLPDIPPMPPTTKLTLDEQQAIVSFTERSADLTEERAIELADILQPLTGEKGKEAITHLNRLSNWFLGAR